MRGELPPRAPTGALLSALAPAAATSSPQQAARAANQLFQFSRLVHTNVSFVRCCQRTHRAFVQVDRLAPIKGDVGSVTLQQCTRDHCGKR